MWPYLELNNVAYVGAPLYLASRVAGAWSCQLLDDGPALADRRDVLRGGGHEEGLGRGLLVGAGDLLVRLGDLLGELSALLGLFCSILELQHLLAFRLGEAVRAARHRDQRREQRGEVEDEHEAERRQQGTLVEVALAAEDAGHGVDEELDAHRLGVHFDVGKELPVVVPVAHGGGTFHELGGGGLELLAVGRPPDLLDAALGLVHSVAD